MDSTFIHDDEEELQAASTNALTEADKRAKAAVVAGGTNTLSNLCSLSLLPAYS
ncbi:hypothetical protein Tco_0074193, partial [Tanacetum coccineum]